MTWIALASITVAAAICFTVLAWAVQYSEQRLDRPD
jgi:hypothetical protein